MIIKCWNCKGSVSVTDDQTKWDKRTSRILGKEMIVELSVHVPCRTCGAVGARDPRIFNGVTVSVVPPKLLKVV